ncbi:MAG: helix-turn-helix transcriptional regulator, partial [Candidatus Tectomicrobia bacterium]|nr:helix-turn-helix transcriptional regulator [Candidatus Tectomicrobia bacterium]
GRPFQTARMVLHVSPVDSALPSLGQSPIAALVLMVDPTNPLSIDPALVAETLGLTPTQGRVAAMLAEGMTVRGISEVTGRTEETTRWHVRRIFSKLGIARQGDLLLRVLSLSRISGRLRRNRR